MKKTRVRKCTGYLPHCCDTIPEKSNLREKGLSFGSQSEGIQPVVARKVWQQLCLTMVGGGSLHLSEVQEIEEAGSRALSLPHNVPVPSGSTY